MHHKKITPSKNYILRLNRGEEVITELTKFCQDNKIFAGAFYGLGACSEAELAHYNVETKEYSKKVFTGEFEIANLTGIITDKKIHAHATIADNQFNVYGGHVVRMVISATCEIHLIAGEEAVGRVKDEAVGLELLNL